ncbi:peptidoglycan editing factor PgeF [Nitratifractor sp.]
MQLPLLAQTPGIRHCIGERDTNLPLEGSVALHTGEDPHLVRGNRRRFADCFDPDTRFVSVLQVHGTAIHFVDDATGYGWEEPPESIRADALATDREGVALCILTADCVPILLADPVRRVVAAIHAGWRGAAEGIVPRTLAALEERYGCDPVNLVAGIGPSIGGCCYEVGEEVAGRFGEFPDAIVRREGRIFLDLPRIVVRQLADAGVDETKIEASGVCTACSGEERFFSYRATGGCTGRFMSAIMLEGVRSEE